MPAISPIESAKIAQLRYVDDSKPGIQRKPIGKHFRYLDPAGKPIKDKKTLIRIKSLGIPPAWTDVWICADENGHIQATGRDAKGRKQYRYHPRWREVRDETKFNRMIAFGEALPRIREQVSHDLALSGLPREKVLAVVVRLLEKTFIRVGNPEYAWMNEHFGLTTLQDEHVDIAGSILQFQFTGKSGKEHTVDINDRRLATIVKHCRDLPGEELFQYLDEEKNRHPIHSTDVNAYLREIVGQEFSAKDFRTWGGTVLAVQLLSELPDCPSETEAKKNITQTINEVAKHLGNTPTICRKYYIHSAVLNAYLDKSLFKHMNTVKQGHHNTLNQAEQFVIRLLKLS